METLKTIWRGFSGMATFAALALTAIGSTGYLFYEGHILFGVSTIAVLCFAFKPMWAYIQKSLM